MKHLELERSRGGPDVHMFVNGDSIAQHAVSLHFDASGLQFTAFFSADEAQRMADMFAEAAQALDQKVQA